MNLAVKWIRLWRWIKCDFIMAAHITDNADAQLGELSIGRCRDICEHAAAKQVAEFDALAICRGITTKIPEVKAAWDAYKS